MPPKASERRSNCVKQETVRKTSLMIKKEVQEKKYNKISQLLITMNVTRMETLCCPSSEERDENDVMDTNE